MKVAIVHYWLLHMRGGEKVVEAICELFPEADIYTHAYRPERISGVIRRHSVQTTFISRLPQPARYYQSYLPLMPLALEQLDLSTYDLIISSESGPAKGVLTRPDAVHVCYCHTPMRYIWNMYTEYRAGAGALKRWLIPLLAHRLRQWDVASAARVDHFIANSAGVAQRIRKYYRRNSVVIYPPVDTNAFKPRDRSGVEDFYLCAGQLTQYKQVDLAVQAFNELGRKLVIIGDGDQRHALTRMAGPNITFLGRTDDATLVDHYARCRALIFPGEEDFGIVPVEAMASGCPVIALGRGGALETVVPDRTGLLFEERTVVALSAAVRRFEAIEHQFDPAELARHAAPFSKQRFQREVWDFLAQVLPSGKFGQKDQGQSLSSLPIDGSCSLPWTAQPRIALAGAGLAA